METCRWAAHLFATLLHEIRDSLSLDPRSPQGVRLTRAAKDTHDRRVSTALTAGVRAIIWTGIVSPRDGDTGKTL